ncbi:uncharacterized protein [Phyllobates terribilis]|uniref:uncharacterized protein n=1 Tax=Phyllobates terribilis TaxID=111132 RepID=UPI003CCB611C
MKTGFPLMIIIFDDVGRICFTVWYHDIHPKKTVQSRELYRIMEFVRNMERRRLIKPQDILATLQSIPEDESESELQEHVFDSDSDEDFIPQNISSEYEDSEGTNPEDIPSTSTGDRAHAVMLPRDHPPGRGQKKSAKRPRNERTTDNDGGEGNATTNTREGESEGILVSADGIQWKPVEIGEHLPGRRDSQNILREAPGPTGYARRNIIIDSPLSAWRLFFDSYILTHIKNCTLAEACRDNNLQFTLSDEELDAFIAIFYARGISGTNRHSISSIWCNDWGIPFCKATMSRDRFVEIMRFLRFDEKSTRSERLQTDKFALFSTQENPNVKVIKPPINSFLIVMVCSHIASFPLYLEASMITVAILTVTSVELPKICI